MKTGNHIADYDINFDPYFSDQEPTLVRCDFCDEKVNDEFINHDMEDGKKTGVVYCCDCEESYRTWKRENHVN